MTEQFAADPADTTGVDIVMIGDMAADENVVQGQTVQATGGAVYFGGMALARLGVRTAVVTRLAARHWDRLAELEAAGIRVYVRASEQTSGVRNVYLTEDMDRRICTPLGFAGAFTLDQIPALQPRYSVVSTLMAGIVDEALVQAVAGRSGLALDVQGFVRVREGGGLVSKDWPAKREILPLVEILKSDQAEGEVLTGESDPQAAAETLVRWGAREVVLTHATGVTVCAGDRTHWAPFVPRSLAGRTGRGDTCLAAYLARRLIASPQEACRFTAAVTSLKLERPGPLAASAEEIERLFQELVERSR